MEAFNGLLHIVALNWLLWDVGNTMRTLSIITVCTLLYHFGHTDRDCYGAIQSSSISGDATTGCHADHACFRLPHSRGYVAWHR